MIKKNFLNGLCAKLALAVVALTTATFTSCENEDFDVTVKLNPAKVTINPTVIYVDDNGANTVTSVATLEFTGATKNGTIGVIEGTEANPAIAATTVTVTASYNGVTKSETVNVAEAEANSQISYPVIIFLYSPAAEITLDYKVVSEKTAAPVTVWGTPSNGHGYNHNGEVWNENASEYFVTVDVKYPVISKQEVVSYDVKSDAVGAETLANFIEALNLNETTTAVYSYTASAYSIFAAYITTTTTTKVLDIFITSTNEVVAQVTVETVSSTEVKVEEEAHPNHAGHYHAGHGHGHGDASNAGGGIIIAD